MSESALSFDTPIASRACRKATASTLCCVMLPSASVNSGVLSRCSPVHGRANSMAAISLAALIGADEEYRR